MMQSFRHLSVDILIYICGSCFYILNAVVVLKYYSEIYFVLLSYFLILAKLEYIGESALV
jgi:hypothetical protein